MGITYIEGTVRGATGAEAAVRFLVDSGATYSLLPKVAWERIGLLPSRPMTFSLADGSTIERDVSECHISLPQGEGHTPVILGEPGDEALLGVVLSKSWAWSSTPSTVCSSPCVCCLFSRVLNLDKSGRPSPSPYFLMALNEMLA